MWEEEGGERDTVTNPHLTKVCRQGGKDLDIFSTRHFLCNYSLPCYKISNLAELAPWLEKEDRTW